jgi:peptidoglycan/LPS O-acetylase OafA/YrhL
LACADLLITGTTAGTCSLTVVGKAAGRFVPSASFAGAPSYEAYRGTAFFSSLDGLRCLSILAVIWHHAGVQTVPLTLARHGYLGVDLFFAISGFLITTLLLREREATGRISLRAFYIRRTLRIFPLYYAVIAAYIIAVLALERNTAPGREFFANLPYFLTYTSNWFVELDGRVIFYFAWSLATEEQFYLIWPTVEKVLRGWRAVGLLIGVLVVRKFVELAATSGLVSADHLAVVVLLSVHPAILGGVAMAHVLHDKRTFGVVKPVLAARGTAPLILAALLTAIQLQMPAEFIWILMVLLVGSVAIRETNGLGAVLRWWPIAHIGAVSYGMYLLHMLTFNTVRRMLSAIGVDEPWLIFAVTVAATIFAATISYRYYESWFLRLKGRFKRTNAAAMA